MSPIETPSSPEPIEAARQPDPTPQSGLHGLLHAWFVQYNPIYLFSAALVLAGLTLLSCDVADDAALGGLGVTAIAELYAFALIGSAALLVHIGARRVAVMVGLLAALYQCDLTMHVETCAFLGIAGVVGALTWIAVFAIKLRLLAAALELRPSRSAIWVPTIGAAGLAILPLTFRHLGTHERTSLVALVVFAVAALALWTPRAIESAVGFDYRGRRAIRGTWLMWAGGALLHVGYWVASLGVELSGLLPVAVLLTARFVRRERSVWLLVGSTLAAVAAFEPSSLWRTALMVSVVLVLRAFRMPIEITPEPTSSVAPPYRGAEPDPELSVPALAVLSFVRADGITMERLLLGAATSLHLALWTITPPEGMWLAHIPLLDVALVATCVFATLRGRRWQSFTPVVPLGAHLVIQLGWLTVPRGATQWGAWAVVVGFVSLGGAVAATWRAHRPRGSAADVSASLPRDSVL